MALSVADYTGVNTDGNVDHSPAPLYKQNNKPNQTNTKQTTTADAIRFYQENFGVIRSFVAEEMNSWIKDVGNPLVLHAMKRALEQNKATWSYVKAILRAWDKKGITTIKQADADSRAFRNRQKRRPYHENGTREAVVPDWFIERKHKQAQMRKAKPPKPKPDPAAEAKEREEFDKLLAEFRGGRK
ncbi:DnaD domain-containing protein [Virgibacillus dakarensis]|uniref:DnaD domain-containing protein n=1 Tax=Virgibacillus dakarensis TaxID=1917889 RepID=UPI00135632C6|nr:DnaD domain protein [Virgibacillus dakarensis]